MNMIGVKIADFTDNLNCETIQHKFGLLTATPIGKLPNLDNMGKGASSVVGIASSSN